MLRVALMKQMGVRSPLVLAKLGHDLRAYYDEVVSTSPPEHLAALIERLPERPSLHVVQLPVEPEVSLASDDPPLA
jgi:hypothetical protein